MAVTIRIRYKRNNETMYVSHLDMMRFFERALRRANLPVEYSMGFNPHPRMVFGLPMPVGVSAEAEYADFDLVQKIDTHSFMDALNNVLPESVRVTGACMLDQGAQNIMAAVAAASYILTFEAQALKGIVTEEAEYAVEAQAPKGIVTEEAEYAVEAQAPKGIVKEKAEYAVEAQAPKGIVTEEAECTVEAQALKGIVKEEAEYIVNNLINNMNKEENITVIKKKDGKEIKTINIKPLIRELYLESVKIIRTKEYEECIMEVRIFALTDAGNSKNLRPDLLAEAITKYGVMDETGLQLKPAAFHRINVFTHDSGILKEPCGVLDA